MAHGFMPGFSDSSAGGYDPAMELLVIRHARPERVVVSTGTADPDLTELGHRQAAAVADALADAGIDHIVSSPMVRARQTAQPLAERLSYDIEVVDGLIEVDAHSNEYMPIEELKAENPDGFKAFVNDTEGIYGPAGRTAFTETVIGAFDSVIENNSGQTVAVFCHGMVTAVWLTHLLGIDEPFSMSPDYAGISRVLVSTRHDVSSVRSFNETFHLAGLPDTRM